jgi:hypothetical protein
VGYGYERRVKGDKVKADRTQTSPLSGMDGGCWNPSFLPRVSSLSYAMQISAFVPEHLLQAWRRCGEYSPSSFYTDCAA